MRAVEEQTVRLPGATLTTTSLAALDQLQSYVKVAQQRLAQGHARLEQRIARQQAQVVEADRQVGLVEKLESRKLAEWQGSLNKELDELAADSYMARMHRQRKLNDG